MSKPLLYFFLGTPGSGRRTVVCDLIARGLEPEDKVLVLTHEENPPSDMLKALATHPQARFGQWELSQDGVILSDTSLEGISAVFVVTLGSASPVDQMEALVEWAHLKDLDVARIFTVVDCMLASTHPKLIAWFEACIHFSDVVFLNKRESVPQQWVKRFVEKFEKEQCYPCLFEYIKKGCVSHPRMLLHPEARRISQVFDERDALYELDIDENNLPDEPFDIKIKDDPYFERLPSGGRAKPVPDVREFL